jgi:predicted 2-oxoglutarate/Fe(II)-dependent dioxygenase YbiX
MSSASLFAKLGVLLWRDLLSGTECGDLVAEVRRVPHTEALVRLRDRQDEVVDASRRRTTRADVQAGTVQVVVQRLLALKPEIEAFFRLSLSDVLESPKFLVYRPGDFFMPHRDVLDAGNPIAAARRVNLILYLNAPSAGADGYDGGELTLYGLVDQPRWQQYGFPVPASAGTLVAFRSDVLHEVAPVTRGARYSIVARMLDPSFRRASDGTASDR